APAGDDLAAVQDSAVHPRRRVGDHHHLPHLELRNVAVDTNAVLDIGLQALIVAGKLAAPILITALVVGFGISLLQSITQIQEVTLSFVPKAVAVALGVWLSGHWMISELVTVTQELFEKLPSLLGGG